MSLLRVGLSLLLPRFRAPPEQAEILAARMPTKLRDSLQLRFVLPLVAFAMVNVSHALIGGFGGLFWH